MLLASPVVVPHRVVAHFIIILAVSYALCATTAIAQSIQYTQNNPDQKLRSNARVNPSSAGMEMSVPLGGSAGRAGTGMPITLNYSSKVWRINHEETFSVYAPTPYRTQTKAIYSEDSASGWTTSAAPPWIEFTGEKQFYDYEGKGVDLLTYDQMRGIYFVKRINIHLSDGSSPEFRKDDGYYDLFVTCPSGYGQCPNYDYTGIYKAVDGSRAYYNFNNSTLYLPDGSRYIFAARENGRSTAAQYIDRHGNTLSYNGGTKEWTDTLGRTIKLPVATAAPTIRTDQIYELTGFGGLTIQYQLRWRYLKDSNTGESALSDSSQELRFAGSRGCNYPDPKNSYAVTPYLFPSDNYERICADSQRFNPVVLHEILLPNNTTYKFSYNVYGEIDRVDYPTGGYERFEYGRVTSFSAMDPNLYGLANRGVYNRWVSAGGGSPEALWQHGGPRVIDPNGTNNQKLITKEVYTDCSDCPTKTPFGFGNIFVGMPYEERMSDSSGVMLRRKLSEWRGDGPLPGGHPWAARNARVTKEVEIILDTGGNALAKTTTYTHDADLNVISTKEYGFVSVDQTTAQTGAITNFPQGALQRTSEATFLVNDPSVPQTTRDAYRARNLVGLPSSSRVRDAANTIVAQSEIKYDESSYPVLYVGGATGWQDPQTNVRGLVTTARSWLNTTNSWLETHAQYDNFGNMRKSWDARGNLSQVNYSANYQYAFATSTTSAVPDPTNTNGTNTSLTSSTTYDFSTGLPTSSTDANAIITAMEYDSLSRPSRVIRAQGIAGVESQTSTIYDDYNRTVTTTSDRDTYNDNILKSQTLYDGLGRTTESRSYESPSAYIATRQEYDALGRAYRTSNPFRPASEQPQWTTTQYDALGRVLSVTTPDNARVTSSYIGNQVTVTDQAGKSRKSETDALGRLTSVWEDPAGLNYQTTYSYDVLGNLRKVSQGTQSRYFMYDSLSRLIRAKQPEQGVNTALAVTDPVTGYAGGWSLAYTYDANSNLATRIDARNITTTYQYDALNRNIQTTYTNDPTSTPSFTRRYDLAVGGRGRAYETRETASTFASFTRTSEYDALGRTRVMRTYHKKPEGTWNYSDIFYTYNLAGADKRYDFSGGYYNEYTYDGAGRVSKVSGNRGDLIERTYASNIQYSAFGGITQEQFGTTTPLYHRQKFNSRGQLYDIRLSTSSTDTENWNRGKLNLHYSRLNGVSATDGTDNNGNVMRSHHWVPNDDAISSHALTYQDYNYDSLNRLTSATERNLPKVVQWTQAFTYDRYGNRTINQAATTQSGIINAKAFTVDVNTNRLQVPSGQQGAMSYDTAGNLTSDTYTGAGARVYDAEGRMIQAADNTGQLSRYVYDGDGHRLRRITGGVEWRQVVGKAGELVWEYIPNTSASTNNVYRNSEMIFSIAKDGTSSSLGVTNSGFESPTIGGFQYNPPGAGWTFTGGAGISANGSGFTSGNPPASEGSQVALLQTTCEMSQVVTGFQAGVNYTVSFLAAQRGNINNGGQDFELFLDSQSLGRFTPSSANYTSYRTAFFTTSAGQHTLRIKGLNTAGGDNTAFVDRVQVQASSAKAQWMVADHLGTPRILADESGSLAKISRHDYLPFGEELFAGTGGRDATQGYSGNDGVRQKFTGHERDGETGLDYMKARYFSSTQGRFTSPDPFGPWAMTEEEKGAFLNEPQQWNRYAYVINNPLKYNDPTGLELYDKNVSEEERKKIRAGLEGIAKSGNREQQRIANFILKTDVLIRVDTQQNIGGSGSSGIFDAQGANKAIASQCLTAEGAAAFITINISKETIANGQMDIEGTLVHEGKHVDNDARTISTLSSGDPRVLFNPTQYANELSAFRAAAGYLIHRGGNYTKFGIGLGIVEARRDGTIGVSEQGIRDNIRRSYDARDNGRDLTNNNRGLTTIRAAGLVPRKP